MNNSRIALLKVRILPENSYVKQSNFGIALAQNRDPDINFADKSIVHHHHKIFALICF